MDHAPDRRRVGFFRGAAQMSEREGRKFFFLLQAILAALFLIVGVALAIEAASGGYGIGLVICGDGDRPGLLFFTLAALSAATAVHRGRQARDPGHGIGAKVRVALGSGCGRTTVNARCSARGRC